MKLITPTPLVAEAADVLAGFRDLVVVVGATAIEVALSDADVAITPTRDVDVVVPVEEAEAIVSALEADGLRRSDVPHERPFTWVRGDLKVQLVRTFHPFPARTPCACSRSRRLRLDAHGRALARPSSGTSTTPSCSSTPSWMTWSVSGKRHAPGSRDLSASGDHHARRRW